jgi:hypothetical protein
VNLTDTYEVRHDGMLFLTGRWTALNSDGLGGMFRGVTPAGRLEHTGLAFDNRGLRTFTVITKAVVAANTQALVAARDAAYTRMMSCERSQLIAAADSLKTAQAELSGYARAQLPRER